MRFFIKTLFGYVLIITLSANILIWAQVEKNTFQKQYLDQAENYLNQYKYDSAIMFYDTAIQQAREGRSKILLAHINRLKGRAYIASNQDDTALIYLDKAIQMAKSIGNDTILAMAYINLANIMKDRGQPDSALNLYFESLGLYESVKDSIGIGKVDNSLAIYYKYTGDFDKGLERALTAKYIFGKLNRYAPLARSIINLGNIYEKLGDYDTALACYEKSYQIGEQLNDREISSTSLLNRIVIYWHWGNREMDSGDSIKAFEIYNLTKKEFLRAITFSKNINDQKTLALLYSNISIINRLLGEYDEAIEDARKAIDISKQLDILSIEINAFNNLGVTYKAIGAYQKAESSYFESLKLARKSKQKESIKKASNNLTNIYELLGDYKKALEYSWLTATYQDSLFNEKKQKLIQEHNTNYEILHLKDMNRIKELDKKRISAERNVTLWVSVFIVVVLLGLLLFFRMHARKNRIISAQKIQKLEDEKKLMAAQSVLIGQEKERERIARELHDGIGVLLSTASIHFSSVEGKTDKETGEMLRKANKLLKEASKEVRHISHNMMPGVLSRFGLKEAVEDLFENVDEAGDVKVDLRLDMGEERLPENMEIMLYRVIQEMINNTLKHAQASTITFSLTKEKDKINMEYTDDGVGFDEEMLPHGKNLGISGIRSRIDYLGGTIKIESHPGKGTHYSIVIPLKDDNK